MSTNGKKKKPGRQVMRGSEYRTMQETKPVIKRKNSHVGVRATKAIFFSIGKVFLIICMILLIICCIVGTALTVFVMKYVDSDTGIDLNTLEVYSTSVVYGVDSNGEAKAMQSLHLNGRREWVDLAEIPQHVQDAFVYTEDERFMDHEGVDWGRTLSSFLKLALKQDASQGGSTITQQLIKNINGDFNNRTIDVKIREILGALQLERHNAKSSILEAYLNYIDLGNGNYGVQAAAEYYFDKDVSELTYAEAASLAATTKSPNNINILDNPERNKERRSYSLRKMLEFNSITQEEYEASLEEEIKVMDRKGDNAQVLETDNKVYNWYVDATIKKVQKDLMDQYGLSANEAMNKINGGGLQIYTTCQIDMQNYLEDYFLDDSNFFYLEQEHPPEGAAIIMDYQGNVQAVVGSRNKKEGNLVNSRATDDIRSAGSAMKPITTYAPAVNSDLITWSTMMVDEPKTTKNGKDWPKNYEQSWSRRGITMVDALTVSKNTIPVELLQRLGIDYCYNFLKNDLHISTLSNGIDKAEGLTLGMNDYGVKLDELCAAYAIFGNNGNYNTPKYYTKVVDMNGKVLLENEPENSYAIDSSSAYIMNKMMQQVIEAPNGTGRQARMNRFTIAGKTGTSDDNLEFSFVGLNPYYVTAIRFGYDQNDKIYTETEQRNIKYKVNKPQVIYKDIMTDLLKDYDSADFELDDSGVVQKRYCTVTGLLAGPGCSSKVGYYKESNLPNTCTGHYSSRTASNTDDE
ncbi:transglycosylase domain-containing protein [Massilimaliae timonensis]|uniref:Penicillin-binding protein 1A n=1 Tax=Massiliimalia timonensis TaxID=1987501 RepID=A0A8J6P9K1_9FIRM|nr:transglycosylase domain-containing protein [Massiliimalia timonensis]MBC8609563.1 transglycosylase domain-containing protein [Massiliimalia timonensis]